MKLWRISNYVDLSGHGGRLVSGRWHHKGRPVVYCADHPSTAMLEALVHVDPDLIPDTYTLITVHVPDDIAIIDIAETDLPPDWRDNGRATRDIGTALLDEARAAVIRVPSAIVPAVSNYLLNPAHDDHARITVEGSAAHPLDSRLFAG